MPSVWRRRKIFMTDRADLQGFAANGPRRAGRRFAALRYRNRQKSVLLASSGIGLSAPGDLSSAARAIRASGFLRTVHTPYSGWEESDPRHQVRSPFLCCVVGAHAGVAGELFAQAVQRDVARAEYHTFSEQPVNSHIVR